MTNESHDEVPSSMQAAIEEATTDVHHLKCAAVLGKRFGEIIALLDQDDRDDTQRVFFLASREGERKVLEQMGKH